ncbi:MAG TPA: histone deacetylase [Candidatus Acidoferrales bacterium]|nr:histone deacetylase [Candidatus Acidoferrales bacterium]
MNIVYDALYGDHLRDIGHPESPDRVEVVAARLAQRGLIGDFSRPRDAADAEIERVHEHAYVELVKREIGDLDGPRYLSTGDVVVDARTLDVARRAAGGAVAAVESSAQRNAPVFALVRPPGHHAESARGMGFCVFNNAAIAARAYQAQFGGRVLLIDFDYHHGNGSQDAVGAGLSYVSTHASPAYPGTGHEIGVVGEDALINVPLPASGIATEAFVAIWEHLLDRAARFVRPDVIVASAGFDYVAGDPVGDLGVDVGAASALARAINATAQQYCSGRVAYVLEGGYDIDALTESVAQVIGVTDRGETQSSGASAQAIPPRQREMLRAIDEHFAR